MNGFRSLAPRLVVIALLTVGLVGMHHLVVAACHHGSSISTVVVVDHPHGAPQPANPPAQHEGGEENPMVELALTCLAVLALLVLVMPGLVRRVRWPVGRAPTFAAFRTRVARFVDPPDLVALSISRT